MQKISIKKILWGLMFCNVSMQIYAVDSPCDLSSAVEFWVTAESELEGALSEIARAVCMYEDLRRLHAKEGRSFHSFEDELTIAHNTVSEAVEACQRTIEKQRQMAQRMRVIFNENIEKQTSLQQKILSLENDQQVQRELLQQLFQLLDQMLVQLKVYSAYMQALDAEICELITQQDSINQCITASTDLTL